jgi:hypothetical protein
MKTNKNSKTANTREGHLSQSELERAVPTTNSNGTLKTLTRISYEHWLLKYQPIMNLIDSNAPFDGYMFETYGADLQFVCAQHPRKIWTLLDCDGKIRICEGMHYVNRLGYFVTEVAAPEDRYFSIKAD